MSREFDSGRIEQVIMLAGLALFLVLATFIPPDPQGLEADMVEPGLAVDLGESIARLANVRFGSKADMCSAKRHVCFTPKSGHRTVTRSPRRRWSVICLELKGRAPLRS